jgi:predicted outer membrane repeat protein
MIWYLARRALSRIVASQGSASACVDRDPPAAIRPPLETLEPRLLLAADLAGGLGAPDDPLAPVHLESGDPSTALDALLAEPGPSRTDPSVRLLAGLDAAWQSGPMPLPLAPDSADSHGSATVDGSRAFDHAPASADPSDTETSTRRELVIVDAAVEDRETLLADLLGDGGARDLVVHVLDGSRDGLEQIGEILGAETDLDAVHLVSHGADGVVQLGAGLVDATTLEAAAERVHGWSDAFAEGADLLLYGCELAASADGLAFLDRLGALTGADVAASDDRTGQVAPGSDWELERTLGEVETEVVFTSAARAAWNGELALVTVDTTDDVVNGVTTDIAALITTPGIDGISLREAIIATNATAGADTIVLSAGTYTITIGGAGEDLAASGDLDILDDLTVVGTGPTGTTISGGGLDRVFDVDKDVGNVVIADLAMADGVALGGGALAVKAGLSTPEITLSNVWIHDNQSTGDGGALHSSGNLTVRDALISSNNALSGGAIYSKDAGDLVLVNVTLSGNDATAGNGGALSISGTTTATLTNVTITDNDASGSGGGIYVQSGSVTIGTSIVAGNRAVGTGPDISGPVASAGYNVVGDSADSTGLGGTDKLDVDPVLGVLQDNGGGLKTHAVSVGSPAEDIKVGAAVPGTDQRGFARDDGAVDAGAFEIGASVAPVGSQLWISTEGAGNVPQPLTWTAGQAVAFDDPGLALAPGPTAGVFSTASSFDVTAFAAGANLNALHVVGADIQVGVTSFQLKAGDVIASTDASVTLTSVSTPVDAGFVNNLIVSPNDVFVFRPDTPGNYTAGTFAMLLQKLVVNSSDVRGVTLIEQSTVVGGTTLDAGDFLFVRNGGFQDHTVILHQTNNVGTINVDGVDSTLLEGTDAGLSLLDGVYGIELVERSTTLGDRIFDSGTILLAFNATGTVGSNALAVTPYDIVALDVQASTIAAGAGNGQATASMVFAGSDVGLAASGEELDALALPPASIVTNAPPVADASAGAPHAIVEGQSLALDGSSSSDPDGDALTYQWDIGNDGSFEKSGVNASYTWAELVAAGADDDGIYQVALKVTDTGGLDSTQVFTLTVANVAPTITVTGSGSAVAGTLYSLDLSALDPGNDAITDWIVNWGDGTVSTQAFTGDPTAVTHTYAQAGFTRNVTVSAIDEDGTWTSSDLVVGNWIAGSDEVFRFDGSTGNPDVSFGSSGPDLSRAWVVVAGPDGNYYASGFDSNNIVRYDANGNYLGIFVGSGILAPGISLNTPNGLAWGPDGNLYVSNYGDDNILRFDATGTFIDEFGVAGALLNGPTGLAFGPDGDLYVSSWVSGSLVKYDGAAGGTPTLVTTGLSSPKQIAFDGAGDLFIANGGGNDVKRWDGATLTSYFSDAQLSFATGLAFGPDGKLYVSSYSNDRILRYDGATAEVFVTAGSGGLDQPEHLTFTPAHQVLIDAPNTAPVLGDATLAAVAEDTLSPPGASVATLFAGLFSDPDSGASLSWAAVATVGDDATALGISAATQLRFVPVTDYNGAPPDLTVRGLDDSYAGAFSTTTGGTETRVNLDTSSPGATSAIAGATSSVSTSISA